MNIEKIIKDNVSKLSSSISKVYVSPDIPKKKLDNAIEKIAHGIESNYVLALIDTTLFGSAKEGFIGLMSIFWTQKVKLFYAALLANNSHCSGVM